MSRRAAGLTVENVQVSQEWRYVGRSRSAQLQPRDGRLFGITLKVETLAELRHPDLKSNVKRCLLGNCTSSRYPDDRQTDGEDHRCIGRDRILLVRILDARVRTEEATCEWLRDVVRDDGGNEH